MTSDGRWLRAARWLPACLAAFELRHIVGWLTGVGAFGQVSLPGGGAARWGGALVALVAARLLRESARGLAAQLPRPRWSRSLVRTWCGCSLAVFAMLCVSHALAVGAGDRTLSGLSSLTGGGLWSVALPAAAVGFLVAVSLRAARWALDMVARHRAGRVRATARRALGSRRPAAEAPARAPMPLLGGWSDRGPPCGVAVTAA